MEKPLEAAVVLDDLSTIYVQHPVDRTNTTRVLELIPPPLSEGSCVISCRLQSISLDSPPAYRAVSYMWGDPSVTQLILVNGKPVMIRSNLWNFLSQMCEEGCYDALWIDALCINHQDIIERSQQVGLMGQIYSKASIVHIWLGPENDLNLVSMQILGVTDWSASVRGTTKTTSSPNLSQQGRDILERAGLGLALQGWGSSFKDQPPYPINRPFFEDEFLAPILEFLNQDYWSRMWIIQEVVLATEFMVQCGSEKLGGDVLENFEDAMYEHELSHMSLIYERWAREHPEDKQAQEPPIFTKKLLGNLKTSKGMRIMAERARRRERTCGLDYGLSRLINDYATHSCSVELDHVYALLSLDKNAHKHIVPKYDRSASDLFERVTVFLAFEEVGRASERHWDTLHKTLVFGAIEQIATALGIDRQSHLVYQARKDATSRFGPLPIQGPEFGN